MTPEHWSWLEVPSGDPRSAWQRYPGRRETSLGTNQLREGSSVDIFDTEIILIIQLSSSEALWCSLNQRYRVIYLRESTDEIPSQSECVTTSKLTHPASSR